MSLVKPVCSAASLISVSRWRIVSIDVGENGRSALAQVGQRIERRLGVARARQRPHQLARLGAHLVGLFAERAGEQAQQRAPALEGFAHLMHRLGVGEFGIGQRPAGIGNNGTRGGGQAVAETAVASPAPPIMAAFCRGFMTGS